MSDLLANLNPPQLQAVTLPPVHGLILAGAGSGKTRVLTTRIAWLISTGQVGPHGILAVTFTNKAAKEMTARLSSLVPINVRGMWIGTFHGLCNRLLRAHYREAGLPQTFQILDSADQLAMVKRLLKNLNIDDEKYPPRELCHFINGQGRDFGPDLSKVGSRLKREQILESILQPSKVIAQGYAAVTVEQKEGDSQTGFIVKDDANELSLKNATGQTVVIKKSNIARQTKLPASLMPEGLAQSLTPQEAADVVSYLESLK